MKKLAAIAILMSAAGVACAGETGFYGQLSAGRAEVNNFCHAYEDGFGNESCDESDTSFGISGGYQFNKFIAVELGYSDLGKIKYSQRYSGVGIDYGFNADFKAKTLDLSALVSLPLNETFELFARAGIVRWDADASSNEWLNAASSSDSASDDGIDSFGGLGVQVNITESVFARAEYRLYRNVGDSDTTGEGGVKNMLASVGYRF